ncbi:MAG: metalloregulator ArsR/SmtB family transcription factor [Parvularculaceae bacterium]
MESKIALEAFSALSQEIRLAVFRHLVRAGPGGAAAGALAEEFDVAPPTMSFHLKELANAGLVLSRKQGRSVIYAADYGGVRDLISFMMDECCQGDPRLCGPYVVREKFDEAPACSPQGR